MTLIMCWPSYVCVIHALYLQVLVFNCDEGIDFQSMGRIFIGLTKVRSCLHHNAACQVLLKCYNISSGFGAVQTIHACQC
jgi:hypothetical protein